MQMRPKIGIIMSTTRPGRFADIPTNWLFNIAKVRTDADFEIVDLRDYPMPFFEEKAPLHQAPPQNEVALRWGKKIASLDGYIFVTVHPRQRPDQPLGDRSLICRPRSEALGRHSIHSLWQTHVTDIEPLRLFALTLDPQWQRRALGGQGIEDQHGGRLGDARDWLQLGQDEGLEGVDILDPDAKDVIQVAGDQQTFGDFRMPTHGG